MIRARDLWVVRRAPGRGEVAALCGVSVAAAPGELVAVLGAPGSGKTTLLEALAGLVAPEAGEVTLETGGSHFCWSAGEVPPASARRRVGFLFQEPERQLFGATPAEDVGWGMGDAGGDLARKALSRAGLDPDLWEAPLDTLSRGECRRVALAGMLVREPRVLLLDEPAVGLDAAGQALLWQEVDRYRTQRGAAVVVATHRPDQVLTRAARVLCLDAGRSAFQGAPDGLLSAARRHPALAGLLPARWRLCLALADAPGAVPGGLRWVRAALAWLEDGPGHPPPSSAASRS